MDQYKWQENAGTLLLSLSLSLNFACGKIKEQEQVNQRNKGHSAGSLNGEALDKMRLSVSGSLEPNGATALRTHQLRSSIIIPPEVVERLSASGTESVDVHLILRDPDGKIVWEELRTAAIADPTLQWTVKLEGREGLFQLSMEVPDSQKIFPQAIPAWEAQVELDTQLPALAVAAGLDAINDAGLRPVKIAIHVTNESDVSCQDAVIEQPALKEPVRLKIARDGAALSGGNHLFRAAPAALDIIPSNAVVRVRCMDRAGNQNEVIQPLSIQGNRALSLLAQPAAQQGLPVGAQPGSPLLAFLRSPMLPLKLNLLDSETGEKVSDAVVQAEKGTMRVFITRERPKALSDLTNSSGLIWTQAYASEMSVTLPGSFRGAQTVSISLVRLDSASNKDVIVSSQALGLFLDEQGPTLQWPNMPLPAAAMPNALTSIKLQKLFEGAPQMGALEAEYSVDGTSWKAVAVQETAITGSPDLVSISMTYPLTAEYDLRLRIKAKDLAGNSVVSPVSPRLFGRTGINLNVAAAERSNCKDGYTLKAWLSSALACKKLDASGRLADPAHVSLLLQNRGSLPPDFYSTAQIAAGMGYRVLVDGQALANGRFLVTDAFNLGSSAVRLLNFPLLPAWRDGQKIEIVFDIENTDAASTRNACYAGAFPFPSVVIQDKAQNLTLGDSPFPCDSDSLLVP